MLKTKINLANALIELLKTKQYEDITILDIVKTAKISRSTYYRNFSSKEDIILFYLDNILKTFLKKITKDKGLTFESYLEALFKNYFEYKEELLLLQKRNIYYLFLKFLNKKFEINNFKYLNTYNNYEIHYHVGGIFNFFYFWISRGMIETPEEVLKIALSFYPNNLKKFSLFEN